MSNSEKTYTIADQGKGDHVPNEVLVKFKKGTSETGRTAALARVGGKVQEHVLTEAMKHFGDREGFFVIHTPFATKEAIGKMRGLGEVEYAEPNYILRHIPLAEANDPYYTNPDENIWGMMGDNTSPLKAPMGSQAAEAWALGNTGSKEVYIGVIDEGVQNTHTELTDNIWVNPFEVKDKKDNDKNGKVDDINGWDFDGRNNTIYDGTSDDHGTHVAGTIGAKGNNGTGVAGVCWDVTIITAKFLGRRGGTTSNAIAAIDYITDLKTRHGLNIVATNNSWGGGGFSQSLSDAIERANGANILFIAAAGNDGTNNDSKPHYPASYTNENIIAVGSLWLDGTKSGFSNYGANSVDIFAPGQRIWSTTPVGGYSNYSGTSMATPHVTGAAALYASVNPGRTAAQVKAALLSSAIPTDAFDGICTTGGRLDAHAALFK
jgi:subtilisin family serine protease